MKYTKEILETVKDCVSIREALVKLGLTPDGGHKSLRLKLKELFKDSPTYKGKAHNKSKPYIRIEHDLYFCKSDKKTFKSFS